jgi:HAD superfamily hydrolase (TIGR01509 family)
MISSGFKLVIFDCDGVLVDSEPIINRAHAEVLTACGYPITEKVLVERFCGMSDPDMLAIIEREWGCALPASYAERVGLMIEAGFRQSLAPIEGVAEALDSLTLPICVASSSSVAQIRQKLGITGLLERFGEHLFSATMVARGKPAPDLFLYAAQRLATVPDRCLVIEDSPAGIDAALAAGMTAIGFCGGSHCGPEHGARLQKHGAALVMDDMLELATAMAKLT